MSWMVWRNWMLRSKDKDHLIHIDTPPPSPINLNLDDVENHDVIQLAQIENSLGVQHTPAKRTRQPKRQRHKRARQSSPQSTELLLDSPVGTLDQQIYPEASDTDWNDYLHPNTTRSTETTKDQLDQYIDLVQADCQGFYWIAQTLFVVQGWDVKMAVGTSAWYHLQRKRIGDEWVTVCFCPSTRDCVHYQFMCDYGDEYFPDNETLYPDHEDVILFTHELIGSDNEFLSRFSVASPGRVTAKDRAIITHNGANDGSGLWSCSKDRSDGCPHVKKARHQLQKLIHANPDARDEGAMGVVDGSNPVPRVFGAAAQAKKSISHLQILPPSWASLPNDLQLYPRCLFNPNSAPSVFALSADGRCICSRSTYSDLLPLERRICVIYTLSGGHHAQIEVQHCPSCPPRLRRLIGPETRDAGLFNYNNRILVTHELLDEYTSAYTSSETPFVAWVTVVSRRYQIHSPPIPFLSEKMFRTIWFSYVHLQHLDTDMQCQVCGPEPADIIWDGITLSFSKKHLLPSLRPPTTIHGHSLLRGEVRYRAGQQLIPDPKVRKAIRLILEGRSLVLDSDEELDGNPEFDDDVPASTSFKLKAANHLIDRVNAIPGLCTKLRELEQSLGDLFEVYFGIHSLSQRQKPPTEYRKLFIQLSAEESVLQMANRPALKCLKRFVSQPNLHTASLLVGIPSLYEVLHYHGSKQEPFPGPLLSLCSWILQRGQGALIGLIVHTAPPVDPNAQNADPGWRITGCCYGLPQLRHRPKYPYLKHDQRSEISGQRRAKCSKYYSKYGEKRLTGGIMCAWCTHSICYGFHCIPRGEGRNDVFSALLTRWPKAPKTVVYDFACALGPYCMVREPEFFADTLFVIDAFHSTGHTKCSPANFLTTYANVDPRLARVNSSAAECGNGGLHRIRKSVSYMSQDRAIVYTRVFLCIWNRLQTQKMAGC